VKHSRVFTNTTLGAQTKRAPTKNKN